MEKKARSKVTPDIATTIDHLQYVIPHADVYFNKEDKDYNNTLEFDISVYSSVAEPGPVDALYVWFDWKSGLTKHPKKVVLSPRDGSGDDWSIEDRGGKPPLPGIEQWWQLKPSPDINWALNKLWSFDFTQLHPIKKALSKCWILPDLGNVSRSDTPVSLSPIPQVLNPGPVIKPFHLVPWGTGQDIKTGDLVSLQWDVQPPMNGQIELGKTSIEIDPNVLDTVNLPLRSTGVHNTVKWPEGVQPSLELTATNNFLGVDLQKKLDSSIMSTQRPEVELHVLDGGKEVEVANPSGSVILQGHVYYATSATLTWDADWVRVEQSGTKLESGGEVTFITDTAQGEQGQLNPITVSLEVDKAGLGLTCATARTITFRLYGKGEPEPTPATVKYTGPYVNALTVFPVSWNSHGQLLLAAQWDVGKYGGSYNHSYDFSAQQGDNINLEEKGLTNTSTILTFMRCVAEFQTPGTATYELTAFGNEGNSFKLKAPQLDQLPRPSSLPNATFDPFPENWAQGEGFLVANDPWQGDIFYLLYYDNAGQAHILQVDSGGLRILNNWPVGTTGQKFSDIKTLQSGVVELFLLDSSDMPSITVFNPANPPSSQAYQLPLPDSDVPTCQPQLLVYGGWPDASLSPVTNVAALLVSDGDSPSVWAANLRWDEPEWNFQSGGLIPVKPGAGSTLKEGFAISRVSSFQRGMAVKTPFRPPCW